MMRPPELSLKIRCKIKRHELETPEELYSFVLGMAAATHLARGRGITADEVQRALDFKECAVDATRILKGLDDYGRLHATVDPYEPGRVTFPMYNIAVLSEGLKRHYREMLQP